MLKNLSLTQRLMCGFGVVVGILAAISVFSIYKVGVLSAYFAEYRGTARESVFAGAVGEDVLEARLASQKYLLNFTDEAADDVRGNIDEVVSAARDASDVFSLHPDLVARFGAIESDAVAYRDSFARVVALQAQRNEEVAKLSAIGPETRKAISEIMESAYEDGDPTAAYFAGRAVQESP